MIDIICHSRSNVAEFVSPLFLWRRCELIVSLTKVKRSLFLFVSPCLVVALFLQTRTPPSGQSSPFPRDPRPEYRSMQGDTCTPSTVQTSQHPVGREYREVFDAATRPRYKTLFSKNTHDVVLIYNTEFTTT